MGSAIRFAVSWGSAVRSRRLRPPRRSRKPPLPSEVVNGPKFCCEWVWMGEWVRMIFFPGLKCECLSNGTLRICLDFVFSAIFFCNSPLVNDFKAHTSSYLSSKVGPLPEQAILIWVGGMYAQHPSATPAVQKKRLRWGPKSRRRSRSNSEPQWFTVTTWSVTRGSLCWRSFGPFGSFW